MWSVAVLAGGRSPEHDVSVRSATQVVNHLDPTKWRVWPIYLDRGGIWWIPDEPWRASREQQLFDTSNSLALRPGAAVEHLLESCGVEIVFPALHGRYGEDGTVQGMLDLHDLPYVGCGTAASAVAMDKVRTRECLAMHGIPLAPAYLPETPLGQVDPGIEAERIGEAVGYPCFLKVDLSGSSVGVAKVTGPDEAQAFLAAEHENGRRYLAEGQVFGEEITVPVIGNSGESLVPLPVVGIYPVDDSYFTHAAKYDVGMCEEIIPPRGLSSAQQGQAQALALRCHQALQCDGLSRTDMIWTADAAVVLEVNTMPGMTDASLLPRSAQSYGWTSGELLDQLLELALSRAGVSR